MEEQERSYMRNTERLTQERQVDNKMKREERRGEPKKTGQNLMQWLVAQQEAEGFRELHWHGTFQDYLNIVAKDPRVARTAFQRIYDMILSYGYRPYVESREDIVHYNFFDDPFDSGQDAVFGLDRALMELVQSRPGWPWAAFDF